MFIDYTATRNLVGSGLDELETKVEPAKREIKTKSTESVSDDGVNREVLLSRYDIEWPIKTVPVPIADHPRWQEFEESTIAGETFSIDINGTKAAPDNVITASVVKDSFDAVRLSPTYWQYTFRIVER